MKIVNLTGKYQLLTMTLIASSVLFNSACNSEGSSTSGNSSGVGGNQSATTPPDLVDLANLNFIQGQLVDVPLSNIGGGSITQCVATLPEGLEISISDDASTCELTGEANAIQQSTNATVTAINAFGESSASLSFSVEQATAFITTWRTDNSGGISDDNQITLQVAPFWDYNYSVDWGDGSTDENVTADITHSYEFSGTYEVSITGQYPQLYLPFSVDEDEEEYFSLSDAAKLLTVEQWGNRPWFSMDSAFAFASHLVINDLNAPDLSRVKSMYGMLGMATDFNSDISLWDVSSVENMMFAFAGASSFNQDISEWNVANVTNMIGAFALAEAFNQPIGKWDVSSVTDMSNMFIVDSSFDQDLSTWDVARVSDMEDMLAGTNLSVAHYDALLNSWSSLPLQSDVSLGVGSNQFSVLGQAGRVALTENFGWTITDGGLLSSPALESAELTLYTNNAITITLRNTGGKAEACTAENLPQGMTVQLTSTHDTCEVTGSPLEAQSTTEASISAIDEVGIASVAILDITVLEETPFITTWKTDNAGASDDNQITLKLSTEFDYDFNVNWGDGQVDANVTTDITHTYSSAGTYSVSITGSFPQIFFTATTDTTQSDSLKLLSVDQWGQHTWLSMQQSFYNADNLVINDSESPDLSHVASMKNMFRESDFFNSDVSQWDVSNVKDMSGMFLKAIEFNQLLNDWDVSNVTFMNGMFSRAKVFNQSISKWDVSNVTNMNGMFENARAFNQPIGDWDVSSVTQMSSLFEAATVFNQDISNWDVSNVTTMNQMFNLAKAFNQDIGNWDVSKVSNMHKAFREARAFNQDIGGWDVSNVTNMVFMFFATSDFEQDISDWNVSKVTNMSRMLEGTKLSVENYDALLIKWSQLDLRENVQLGAGSLKFSSDAQAARDFMTDTLGWVITDGGQIEE